jgi:hypothetical protein
MEAGLAEVAELHPDGGLVKSALGARFRHGKRPAKGVQSCGCHVFASSGPDAPETASHHKRSPWPLAEEALGPVELRLSCLRRGSRYAPVQLRLR